MQILYHIHFKIWIKIYSNKVTLKKNKNCCPKPKENRKPRNQKLAENLTSPSTICFLKTRTHFFPKPTTIKMKAAYQRDFPKTKTTHHLLQTQHQKQKNFKIVGHWFSPILSVLSSPHRAKGSSDFIWHLDQMGVRLLIKPV